MTNSRWLTLFAIVGSVALSCSDNDSDAASSSTGGAGGAASGAAGQGGRTSSGGASVEGGSSAGVGGASFGGSSAGEGGDGGAAGVWTSGGSAGAGAATAAGASGASGSAGDTGTAPHDTCVFPAGAEVLKAQLPVGFCAWEWAANVLGARGITVDSEGNVLVVAQTAASVLSLWDADGDGVSAPSERATIATSASLNHSVALHDGYLYASSAGAVTRWPYTAARALLAAPAIVVNGMPTAGHVTRTLAFSAQHLYVSIGSGSNVDPNSSRARIVRFPLSGLGAAPVAFASGEVFADGLRNEVGITFDDRGRLWGVENGRDDLARSDLGGDIHADNPGEELNLFAQPGRFYGYPYCWTEFSLPSGVGLGLGTQWADPATLADGTHTDAWCRNATNVVPPVLSMQAHSAPLDLLFYGGTAFPAAYRGGAFVTFHGSWNRPEPTGYKVMHIAYGASGLPLGNPTPVLEYSGAGDIAAEWRHRPVGLAVLPSGVLLVTSDASNSILAIGYRP